MRLATAAALSLLLSVLFVRALASPLLASAVLDHPNERSLHSEPVPRSGGLGLLAAVGLSWLAFAAGALALPLLLAACLCLASLLDDVRPLPAGVRLIIQAAAAAVLLWPLHAQPPLLLPLIGIGIVWMTNLYNFMDGADGLAGGMTVAGFGGYAAAALLAGEQDIAMVSAIIAAAALGFLLWNFHPARIFLGDCGSVPLGFLAAAIGVVGWTRAAWAFWFPLVLFAPFIVDASLTLLRRAARGDNVFSAHREHYYQRLVRSGFGQRRVVLAAYGLMALCLLLALATRNLGAIGAGLVLIVLGGTSLLGAALIERRLAHSRDGTGEG